MLNYFISVKFFDDRARQVSCHLILSFYFFIGQEPELASSFIKL